MIKTAKKSKPSGTAKETTSTGMSGVPAAKKTMPEGKSVSPRSKKTVATDAPTSVKSATDGARHASKRANETALEATLDASIAPTAPMSSDKAPQSRIPLSTNNASAGVVDNIHRSAVSKVTEVATKSSKTSSAASADGTPISEAQLLKMSEKEYMNEAQLAFFKARLQQLEKDLLKNAGETTEHLRETVLVPDPADRATIEEEHALELRTRDRERKLLKKVQQSIASIDGGDYGWCEETGEPIGIPRLLARPTATLSLEAQQRRELKQKLYGD